MTILIVGASGRTSSYVAKAVLSSQHLGTQRVRLLARSEKSANALKNNFGDRDTYESVVCADLLAAGALRDAMKDVGVVWYNGPTFISLEVALGIAVIDAAIEAGVKHFVFCSGHEPSLSKLPHHTAKVRIEEYLVESGIDYTILQPTSFMQNLPLAAVVASGKLPCIYTPTVLKGLVDLEDVAEAAARILLDPSPHRFARYECVGQNTTLEAVAQELSAALGKPIECVRPPRDKVVEGFLAKTGISGYVAQEGFERMLFYYDKRGIPGSSNTLRWLLGQEPRTISVMIAAATKGLK